MTLSDEIGDRFRANLGRVRDIVSMYSQLSGRGPGRSTVRDSDLLRAAVVLLHASLEDVMRSLAEARLPIAKSDVLEKIPLVGLGKKLTFNLGDLATHRGLSVDEVVKASVVAFLERSNYNSVGEIKNLLESIGLKRTTVDAYAAQMETMMKRRHLIAHRADQNEVTGSGQHRVRSISRAIVERWADATERFVAQILATL